MACLCWLDSVECDPSPDNSIAIERQSKAETQQQKINWIEIPVPIYLFWFDFGLFWIIIETDNGGDKWSHQHLHAQKRTSKWRLISAAPWNHFSFMLIGLFQSIQLFHNSWWRWPSWPSISAFCANSLPIGHFFKHFFQDYFAGFSPFDFRSHPFGSIGSFIQILC